MMMAPESPRCDGSLGFICMILASEGVQCAKEGRAVMAWKPPGDILSEQVLVLSESQWLPILAELLIGPETPRCGERLGLKSTIYAYWRPQGCAVMA